MVVMVTLKGLKTGKQVQADHCLMSRQIPLYHPLLPLLRCLHYRVEVCCRLGARLCNPSHLAGRIRQGQPGLPRVLTEK